MALNLHHHIPAYCATFNFVPVIDKHMQCRGRLDLQPQGFDQALLHEIVCVVTVDQDHNVVVGNPTHRAQGFGGGVARKSMQTNLGLKRVVVRVDN